MALLQSRRLITAITLAIIFLPMLSFSQVKIKEKVEVHPKAPANVPLKSERNARTVAGSNTFFDPPLFVNDPNLGLGLALTSTLTISGSVTIGGDILGNQHAKLLVVSDQEHPIAWKGKFGWVGELSSGESPYTGTFSAESYPDVRLYLFDYLWTDGERTITFNENTLTYDFTGLLYQGTSGTPVPVTANATVSGSILPQYRFDHWGLGAENMRVTGRDSTWVGVVPLDGTGGEPGEDGTPTEGGEYSPWCISPKDVEVTLRVDAAGDYVFLAYEEVLIDETTGELIVGPYHSGREITMPLAIVGSDYEIPMTPVLVYDDSKGTFEGQSDTVYITVTGEGKSTTIPVVIEKSEILLGETKYFYVARVDGEPKIKETKTTTLPGDFFPSFTWGDNPVTRVQEEPNSGKPLGKKSGVYWETGKPIPNSTGNLPAGMIRLVGRYWHADSVYQVQLKATHPKGSVSSVIKVEKPSKLGNQYSVVTDVKGHTLQLDDEIIKYAGQWGIPPQIIKGQIERETVPMFTPCWRYEPFLDIMSQKNVDFLYKKNGTKRLFVVDSAGMGGDFPSDHSPDYVKPTDYEKSRLKLSSFLEDHLERYVDRIKMVVVYNNEYARILTYKLKQCYKDALVLGLKDTKKNKDAANFAIELMKNAFHWKENGSVYDVYAQTRIATSYGYFQMMYPTAVTTTFEETGSFYDSPGSFFMSRSAIELPPEKLNEYEYLFPRHVDFTLQHLREALGKPTMIPESNWTMGFEKTWIETLQKHNRYHLNYGLEVISNSSHYWPSINK